MNKFVVYGVPIAILLAIPQHVLLQHLKGAICREATWSWPALRGPGSAVDASVPQPKSASAQGAPPNRWWSTTIPATQASPYDCQGGTIIPWREHWSDPPGKKQIRTFEPLPSGALRVKPSQRVAVCLVGQFRKHFETVYRTDVFQALVKNERVDFFIETWDTIGHCTREEESEMKPLNIDWKQCYEHLVHLAVEAQPENATYELHGLTMPTAILSRKAKQSGLGTLPHAWKMHRCAHAIRAEENKRNRPYDCIIKMRPDSKFWAYAWARGMLFRVTKYLQDPGGVDVHFSTCSIDKAFQVSDKYAFGSSAGMFYYLDSWSNMKVLQKSWMQLSTRAKQNSEHERPVGERLMFLHMQMGKFKTKPFADGDRRSCR